MGLKNFKSLSIFIHYLIRVPFNTIESILNFKKSFFDVSFLNFNILIVVKVVKFQI